MTKRVLTFVVLSLAATVAHAQEAPTRQTVVMRGRPQVLHVYGRRGGQPVIVASGDGGWIHLGPHVAELLAANGRFVVGFDVKSYLESFTGAARLKRDDVAGDFKTLVDVASSGNPMRPIVIGVSEGAALAVLAAAEPQVKMAIGGVIGLGLPDRAELAWRWTDSIIYLTHAAPREPSFSTADIVARLAPLPLAAIHSTRDEYVPLQQVRQVLDRAAEPKRLWTIDAANHRFGGRVGELDRRLFEAMAWVETHAPAR